MLYHFSPVSLVQSTRRHRTRNPVHYPEIEGENRVSIRQNSRRNLANTENCGTDALVRTPTPESPESLGFLIGAPPGETPLFERTKPLYVFFMQNRQAEIL